MDTEIAVAILLVNSSNEILYQLRDKNPNIFQPDVWGLLGGAMEENEMPEDALYRELVEEIEYKPDNITFFRYYHLPEKKAYVFVSSVPFKDPSFLKLHEGQKLQFFSKEEILELFKRKKTAYELWEIIGDYYKECEEREKIN